MRKGLLSAWFVLFLLPCSSAGGVAAGMATEWTQLLVLAKHIQEYETQIEQKIQMVNMYLNMVRQAENIGTHPFEPIAAELQGIYSIAANANAIAYSLDHADVQFSDTYRGFIPVALGGRMPYNLQYQAWYQNSMSAIQATLQRNGLNANQIMSRQGMMSALAAMARTPAGQVQAAQLGNEIGLQTASSLDRLQAIITSNYNTDMQIQGMKLQQEAAQAANSAALMQHTERTSDEKVF